MTDPTFDDLIPPRPAGALHYGEPTFDDLIPWQPAGVPHYGEPTFDDLIPNQGAPWQPSSSGDGAVHFGPPVGEAVAGQAVQQSQPIARPVQTPAAPVTPIVPDDIVARPPQTRDFTTDLPKVTRHGPSDGSTASVPTPQASSSQISKPSGANLHHAGDLSQQQMPKPDPGELTARWAVAHVGAGVQDGYAKVAPNREVHGLLKNALGMFGMQGFGAPKCNVFVSDALSAAGIQPYLQDGTMPLAEEWGDPNVPIHAKGGTFQVVNPSLGLTPGDIIAADGHVAIYTPVVRPAARTRLPLPGAPNTIDYPGATLYYVTSAASPWWLGGTGGWTGDVTMNASWGVGHTPGAVVRRFVPNSAVRNPSWGVQ